jgi:hypothetical protein
VLHQLVLVLLVRIPVKHTLVLVLLEQESELV